MSKVDIGQEPKQESSVEQELWAQFPDELAYLSEINDKLDRALQEANDKVDLADKEYMDSKRYMAQYRGEIDPHEMLQNELALRQLDSTGAFVVGIRDKLAKLKDSPYFARIDFKEAGEEEAFTQYIGRFAFSFENELLVADWRSPIASMFYDYEVGPAGFDAPACRIEGELTRKRQFKIKGGKLEYVLESAMNIQDDVLQKELSQTSDEKMKSIIGTIQKEQNRIIRNEKSTTLIIQGVAGSGKTSIALHRVAFLLYRFKDKLSARNITILSPNSVFGDYISNVLPELGEEEIYELSFRDIAEVELGGVIDFEPDKDPLEINDPEWAERVQYKSTLTFVKQMDLYLQEMPERIFKPEDYSFDQFTAPGDWILARYNNYHKYPVKKRLLLVAEDIYNRFETDNFMAEELPDVKTILKSLNSMLSAKSTLALYQDFYERIHMPVMFIMPRKKTLEWADVFPFLYLHGDFEGLKEADMIKHLVIDEMQDYTPIQYAVINLLFQCQKTILGDFGQSVNPNHLHHLGDIKYLYREADIVELNKSYRSTYEIINFARKIRDNAKLEPIERHGEAPAVISCKSGSHMLNRVKGEIQRFQNRDHTSLGIITKTNCRAKEIYELLEKEFAVHLISPGAASFASGISVTPVQMAKGLEFDEVIVVDADDETYSTDYDRCLLYVACTRAMHRLTLIYSGKRTKLICDKQRQSL